MIDLRHRLSHSVCCVWLCLLALLITQQAQADSDRAGSIMFVSGPAHIQSSNQNKPRPLQAGNAVRQGDSIVVGTGGTVQLVMSDSTRFTLHALSKFTVDTYSYQSGSLGIAHYFLQRGKISVISGLISKQTQLKTPRVITGTGNLLSAIEGTGDNVAGVEGTGNTVAGIEGTGYRMPLEERFAIVTPHALVTVLGTNFSLYTRRDTLHAAVSSGAIAITTPSSRKVVRAGKSIVIKAQPSPAAKSAVKLTTPPPFVEPNDKPEEGVPTETPTLPTTSDGARLDGKKVVRRSVSLGANNVETRSVGNSEATPRNLHNDQTLLSSTQQSDILVGNNQLGTSQSGITWGRWDNWQAGVGADTSLNNSRDLHWVVGPAFDATKAPTLPSTGTVSYTYAGGTTPTSASGENFSVLQNTLTANFSLMQIQNTLQLSGDQGTVVSASGVGDLTSTPQDGIVFSGIYSPLTSTANGSFSGFMVPSNTPGELPTGAGLTFQLNPLGSTDTINGAAAFDAP